MEAKVLNKGRGFLGELERTNVPCPKCKVDGSKTNGGETPTLRKAADGTLHCMGLHGQIKQQFLRNSGAPGGTD